MRAKAPLFVGRYRTTPLCPLWYWHCRQHCRRQPCGAGGYGTWAQALTAALEHCATGTVKL